MENNKRDEIIKDLLLKDATWEFIAQSVDMTRSGVRSYAYRQEWYKDFKRELGSHTNVEHRDSNSSITSEMILQRNSKELFTESELLEIHGFDPREFKIKHVTSNEWTTPGEDTQFYNYQSKISVIPIAGEEKTQADFLKSLNKEVTPVQVRQVNFGKNNVIIALSDMHFGETTMEDLQTKLEEIQETLKKGYKEVVIMNAGDFFHSDDMFSSRTIAGTVLETVDMVRAVEDAKTFMHAVFTSAQENAEHVSYRYVAGNHSSFEYFFNEYLIVKYPQVTVHQHNDLSTAFMIDNVLIALAHGHKIKKNNLSQVISYEYRELWGRASEVHCFTGHYHQLESQSLNGVIVHQLGTPKQADTYERQNGWIASRKLIQMFEFNTDQLKTVHYI
nr:MAG TPA: vacuolar protein sorting-associated protein [Caudoviricetes sp.]